MVQTRSTGAAADEWGRATARCIATLIGARLKGRASNEAVLKGASVVIKCAAPATNSVGVTFRTLGRIQRVIAAFQRSDGSFDLWSLSSDAFRSEMGPTRSRGPSAGKVGIVKKAAFAAHGRKLGRIRLDPAG